MAQLAQALKDAQNAQESQNLQNQQSVPQRGSLKQIWSKNKGKIILGTAVATTLVACALFYYLSKNSFTEGDDPQVNCQDIDWTRGYVQKCEVIAQSGKAIAEYTDSESGVGKLVHGAYYIGSGIKGVGSSISSSIIGWFKG